MEHNETNSPGVSDSAWVRLTGGTVPAPGGPGHPRNRASGELGKGLSAVLPTSTADKIAIVEIERVDGFHVEGKRLTRATTKAIGETSQKSAQVDSVPMETCALPNLPASEEETDPETFRKPKPRKDKPKLAAKRRRVPRRISSDEDTEPTLMESDASRKSTKTNPNIPDLEDELFRMKHMPLSDVGAEIFEHLEEIRKVAKTSKNLKGTYIRKLNSAAVMIQAATTILTMKSGGTVDSVWLQQRNTQLENDVKQLKLEVKQLIAALAKHTAKVAKNARKSHNMEDSISSIPPSRVGSNLESRVYTNSNLPDPISTSTTNLSSLMHKSPLPSAYRPLLQGKRKLLEDSPQQPRMTNMSSEERDIDDLITKRIDYLLAQRQRLRNSSTGPTPNPPVTRSQTVDNQMQAHQTQTSSSPTDPNTAWSTVVGRKQRRKERKQDQVASVAMQSRKQPSSRLPSAKSRKRRAPRRPLPLRS